MQKDKSYAIAIPKLVNPIFYFFNDLSPADFEEIIVLSSRDSQTMDWYRQVCPMPYKPHRTEKIYYSISEVAGMFDVNASLIRFWEKEFDILQPKKNKKGNRLFTQTDVENIHLIYHLVKERGFTLEGARKQLEQNRDEAMLKAQVTQSLTKIRTFLEEIDGILAGSGSR